MKTLINRLTKLGYNLTTLEQQDNGISFMRQGHLVLINSKADSKGYTLRINSPKSRYKITAKNEQHLLVCLSDYFC